MARVKAWDIVREAQNRAFPDRQLTSSSYYAASCLLSDVPYRLEQFRQVARLFHLSGTIRMVFFEIAATQATQLKKVLQEGQRFPIPAYPVAGAVSDVRPRC